MGGWIILGKEGHRKGQQKSGGRDGSIIKQEKIVKRSASGEIKKERGEGQMGRKKFGLHVFQSWVEPNTTYTAVTGRKGRRWG